MININRSHISEAAQIHLGVAKGFVEPRLNFLIDLLEVVVEQKNIERVTDVNIQYDLHSDSLRTLINPLLIEAKRKTGRTYNIEISDVSDLVYDRDLSILENADEDLYNSLLNFFRNVRHNLNEILIGSVSVLNDVVLENEEFGDQNVEPYSQLLKKIFYYEKITSENGLGKTDHGIQWDNYKITKEVGIDVCPYCNRNWINTVKGANSNKITNPELDHFFCKDQYPLLGLSFYNLIPSCKTCNSRIKLGAKMVYGKHLSPYERGYGEISKFQTIAKDTKSSSGKDVNFSVNLIDTPNVNQKGMDQNRKNFEFFKIKEIYEVHGDLIADLYFIKTKFGIGYLSNRVKMGREQDMDIEEMYKVLFSNYYFEKDFHKRPFAKLTRDIVEDLKLL